MPSNSGSGRARAWFFTMALLLLLVAILNAAGWALNLFRSIPPYDEVVHFLTPFTLVAVVSAIIYRSGGRDEFFSSSMRALVTGAVLGLLGAVAWELVEVALSNLFPRLRIPMPPLDTAADIALGTVGGAVGAHITDWRLDRARRRR